MTIVPHAHRFQDQTFSASFSESSRDDGVPIDRVDSRVRVRYNSKPFFEIEDELTVTLKLAAPIDSPPLKGRKSNVGAVRFDFRFFGDSPLAIMTYAVSVRKLYTIAPMNGAIFCLDSCYTKGRNVYSPASLSGVRINSGRPGLSPKVSDPKVVDRLLQGLFYPKPDSWFIPMDRDAATVKADWLGRRHMIRKSSKQPLDPAQSRVLVPFEARKLLGTIAKHEAVTVEIRADGSYGHEVKAGTVLRVGEPMALTLALGGLECLR